jgi:CHASE1-domain containing sensor protein
MMEKEKEEQMSWWCLILPCLPVIQTALSIAALISSALIFYFGYSQTKKSEQTKIAREIDDRIQTKSEKLEAINSCASSGYASLPLSDS